MPDARLSPTQRAVLLRMRVVGCEVTWTQAVHGVRRASYATVRVLKRLGLVEHMDDDEVRPGWRLTSEGWRRAEAMAQADRAMRRETGGW